MLPDFTELELTSVTREVQGHRIKGTMETVPCSLLSILDVKIVENHRTYGNQAKS